MVISGCCQVLIFPRRRRETVIKVLPSTFRWPGSLPEGPTPQPLPHLGRCAWQRGYSRPSLRLCCCKRQRWPAAVPRSLDFRLAGSHSAMWLNAPPPKKKVSHPVSRQTGKHPCLQPTAIPAVTRA